MAKADISTKRIAISKANAQIVAIVGVASFVTIFCLVAAHAVWSQTQYQAHVTTAKTEAHQKLVKNIKSFETLNSSYDKFISSTTNAIGGSSTGTGDNDGDNAKIVLDALPSSYDFPALASSLEKIMKNKGITVSSITGTDDQLAQQTNVSSPNPKAVAMPFTFTVTGANYTTIQQLMTTLQSSIRPIQIDSLTISGSTNNIVLTVSAHSYYQPGKSLTITKKVVK